MKEQIIHIVDLMLTDVQKRLMDKQLIITVTDNAKNFVIEDGFDPEFGARPLKRYIQRTIETLIAKTIISTDLEPGTELVVDYAGDDFICKVNPPFDKK